MAWNDAPPTQQELASGGPPRRWDQAPPTDLELQSMGAGNHLPMNTSLSERMLGKHPGKDLARASIEALPLASGAVGGLIGTGGAPGMGTVLGGGLGYSAGQNLADVAKEKLLGDEPKSLEDTYANAGKGFVSGAFNEMGGQGLVAAPKVIGGALAKTSLGQKAIGYGQKVAGKIGSGLAKAGEALTNVPEQELSTYAAEQAKAPLGGPNAIDEMAEASKARPFSPTGEVSEKPNTYRAADSIRQKMDEKVQAVKDDLNDTIKAHIDKSDPSERYDISSITDALDKEKAKFNPNAEKEQIAQIDDLITKVKAFTPGNVSVPKPPSSVTPGAGTKKMFPFAAEPAEEAAVSPLSTKVSQPAPRSTSLQPGESKPIGLLERETTPLLPEGGHPENIDNTVSLDDLNKIKRMFQGEVDGSYRGVGEMFNPSSPRVNAARAAGAEARKTLNTASPEIAEANTKLSNLHDVDNKIRSSILKEGSPEHSLISAGNGTISKNIADLQDLSDLTGHDMVGEARKLAAMKNMYSPKYLPIDSTGKATLRSGAGAITGGLIGAAAGGVADGQQGAIVGGLAGGLGGGLMTSPLVVKKMIDAGLLTAKSAQGMMNTPAGRQMLGEIVHKMGNH